MSGSSSGASLVSSSTSVLDTFRTSAPSTSPEAALKKLKKRAQSKYVTNVVAFPLAQLRSPLAKAYKLSTNCAGELTEKPGKFTSLYCGCRWCLVCSRIRTARLIVGYLPAIQAMSEKWFLTLSRPNVVGAALEDEIRYYLKEASLIQRHLREKRKLEYSSLRKIECTYNEAVNTYHPHFHFIFDSWEAGNAFLNEWLTRNPTAKLDKGNQLKKANDKSVVELFKYFTKVVSKSKSTTANGTDSVGYRIHLEALDTMFLAMRRVRTFQPCGVIKAVSEDVEPEQALESGRAEVNHWKWLGHDWVNVETTAALTGFVPSEHQKAIAKNIVYPVNVAPVAPTDVTPYYVDKETGEVVPTELVDVKQMRNNIQYAKIYPAVADDEAKARRKPCNLPATKCPVLFLIWKDVPEEPAQPVLAVEPPAPAQLGLFAQPAAAPAAPIILLPAIKSSSIKKPSSKKGLATAQAVPYFQALPSESQLFSLTG
jgi:hypothetical protein